MNINPFIYGNPVANTNFFGRQDILTRVKSRIGYTGQSTAIIGEPRIGKTSLLLQLQADPNIPAKDFNIVFTLLDSHLLAHTANEAVFWEQALNIFLDPEEERLKKFLDDVNKCMQKNFSNASLKRFFKKLKESNIRFVLLLDEFDSIVEHPILSSSSFFGGLRSLASLNGDSFAIILSSRQSLSSMNKRSQELAKSPTGSPFFNIFAEFTLGALPDRDIAELLTLGDDYFDANDRNAIHLLAGGHPFLLQAAASSMWHAHEEGTNDPIDRAKNVSQQIYKEHKLIFEDTWHVWTPAMRKAFTAVGLAHTSHLLPNREFLTDSFIEQFRDWNDEFIELEKTGLLVKDTKVKGGWRIMPQAFLWWLADELVKNVRDDTSFDEWLRAQELDGNLTRDQKDKINNVMLGAVQSLKNGASTLVEAFATGVGTNLAG